ncbi:alpha-E domain-containing protein [Yoonia sp. 208BN28-4]|uniref:alpha-E domain-containing protein n=1 Tax=Yoonia sp. 208BN28-4 TaxID=3126505 RepID=UPI0030969B1D
MLGKTAGGLYWMMRYMERTENTARMIDAGLRISLTRSSQADSEWSSILKVTGQAPGYHATYDKLRGRDVCDFMLRDRNNPSSVICAVEAARMNAKLVRTALTREVWEAVNECWMTLDALSKQTIAPADLPEVLQIVRQRAAYVRGALHGSMLRNDNYNFARIGTFYERADSVARILDAKYHILLPSVAHVGSISDNMQWEAILRANSATRAYQTLHEGDYDPRDIAQFLILDRRLPRSLAFCYNKIADNMRHLEQDYGERMPCHDTAHEICDTFMGQSIEQIFEQGLHEFITAFLQASFNLGVQIERDYRFVE